MTILRTPLQFFVTLDKVSTNKQEGSDKAFKGNLNNFSPLKHEIVQVFYNKNPFSTGITL